MKSEECQANGSLQTLTGNQFNKQDIFHGKKGEAGRSY